MTNFRSCRRGICNNRCRTPEFLSALVRGFLRIGARIPSRARRNRMHFLQQIVARSPCQKNGGFENNSVFQPSPVLAATFRDVCAVRGQPPLGWQNRFVDNRFVDNNYVINRFVARRRSYAMINRKLEMAHGSQIANRPCDRHLPVLLALPSIPRKRCACETLSVASRGPILAARAIM